MILSLRHIPKSYAHIPPDDTIFTLFKEAVDANLNEYDDTVYSQSGKHSANNSITATNT